MPNYVDDPLGYLYQNVLGRAPDAAGQAYYQNELKSGLTGTDVYLQMAQSPEGQAYRASGHPASSGGGFGFASNPYLGGQSDAIRAQQTQLFNDMNQGIKSQGVATGGYGGSRMGVAQGVAEGRAATGLSSALAGMYGNAYEGDQNRGLQQYGMDQNFYTQQRGQDQSGAALGATMYGQGVQGQWSPYANFSSTMAPYTGFGTTTGTSSQGGGVMGAFGGALGGAQIGNIAGGSSNPYGFLSGGNNNNSNFFNPYSTGGTTGNSWGFKL